MTKSMKTRLIFWIAILCLCLQPQIGWAAGAGESGELRIIYGTGLRGYWEPCG